MDTTTINRVQFNSSTLKASYTAGTSKAQLITWPECVYCEEGETPRTITVIISNVVMCTTGCTVMGSGRCRRYWSNLAGSYVLTPASGCVWSYSQSGSYGYRDDWIPNHCSGAPTFVRTGTNLSISVTQASETTGSFTMAIGPYPADGKYADGVSLIFTGCGVASGSVSNDCTWPWAVESFDVSVS